MNLVRSLGSVGGMTLASRLLALVRDALQATYVGAGFAAGAFLTAFRLPNMFRSFFAEGAFNAAFIPMFNRKITESGELSVGLDFASRALSVLFWTLVLFTILLLAAAWPLTWALSGGFKATHPTEAQFAFAVSLSRITIPYLMLISLASLLGGILNSLEKFWVNAAAPVLLNVAMVIGLAVFHGHDTYATARVQAICIPVGGVLQLGWLIIACRQAGVSLKLRWPRLDADVRELMKLILPAAMGAGAVQVNLLISSALAGGLVGASAIDYIYYADRVNQLPLGMIGIGLGTVLLPTVTRLLHAGREEEAMDTQNRGMELALFLTLPAAAALIFAPEPIIRGIFQHGAFTAADAVASSWALSAFSIGLPSYVLVKVLTPGFYARGDTKTPLRFALYSVAVNIVGNVILIPVLNQYGYGHVGPPLATAVSSSVNVGLLYWALRRRGHFHADRQLKRRLPRLLFASLIMGALLFLTRSWVDRYVVGSLLERAIALALLVGAGAGVYGLACFLTGAFALDDVRLLLQRRAGETR